MTSLESSKPVVRKTVASSVPHGVNPNLVIKLYPRGIIGLRELRRKREYFLDVGRLYVGAVISTLAAERKARRKARRNRA